MAAMRVNDGTLDVLSSVRNGEYQVDHAQNQGSASVAFRVRPQSEADRGRGRRVDHVGVALPAPNEELAGLS